MFKKLWETIFINLVVFLLVLVVFSDLFNLFRRDSEEVIKQTTEETVKFDTASFIKTYEANKLKAEPEPIRIDTFYTEQDVNVDSIFDEAKRYWNDRFIAEVKDTDKFETAKLKYSLSADTTITEIDSSKNYFDSTYIKTTFVSPIPLSPKSYFNLLVNRNTKTINITTTVTNNILVQKQSFFDRFSFAVFFGPALSVDDLKFSTVVGIGVAFKL